MSIKITLTSGQSYAIAKGESVLDSLKRHKTFLVSSCGGKGTCGKCKVVLKAGEAEITTHGKLSAEEKQRGVTLACKTQPLSDITIEVPESSRLVIGDKIAMSRAGDLVQLLKALGADITPALKQVDLELPPPSLSDHIGDLQRLRRGLQEKGITGMRFSHGFAATLGSVLREAGWHITLAYTEGPEAVFVHPKGNGKSYGIAVDIGTTTVVLYLVDLNTGALIDTASTYNSQIRYGDDVITRIVNATEGGQLQEIQQTVIDDINSLINPLVQLHGIERETIQSAVISGNTTMSQLFWGLDPAPIREEPYIPALNFYPRWKASTARIEINPQALLYTMPCMASYVGGDIVAGVLASKMHKSAETSLFMDIGTNGEIAIGGAEWLVTAACSAGPCFEGSGIRDGMRATQGAIEAVKIDPETFEPDITIVGGGSTASGICGSAMIDAVSELFLKGIIDQKGKFQRELMTPQNQMLRDSAEGPEYVLYRGQNKDVALTEVDIENIIRAKAAIYAGVSLLLREVGLPVEALDKVYIAGGFGNYLNVDKAIILGMLPDMPRDKYKFIGNTSIAGAYLCLMSGEMIAQAEDIASRMTYMDLSSSGAYMDEYMSALFLPHTDMSLFPTTEGLMKGGGQVV